MVLSCRPWVQTVDRSTSGLETRIGSAAVGEIATTREDPCGRNWSQSMASELRVRTRAELLVLDFSGSANRITEVLGVMPTRTWKAGDLVNPKIQAHDEAKRLESIFTSC